MHTKLVSWEKLNTVLVCTCEFNRILDKIPHFVLAQALAACVCFFIFLLVIFMSSCHTKRALIAVVLTILHVYLMALWLVVARDFQCNTVYTRL